MKKTYKSFEALIYSLCFSQKFLTMRITALLLFFSVFQVMGEKSYSQNALITLNLHDVTVERVLDDIESQSEFYFLFNQKLVDVNRKVDIEVEDEKIRNFLMLT